MAAARWAQVVGLLLLLALPALASSSSMVLKLKGNVYPVGEFYVTMDVGEPAKPYFLDIDTGSTLTWLECDVGHGSCQTCNKVPHPLYRGTKNKLVPCAHPLCHALHRDLAETQHCADGSKQCDYEIHYLDGFHSRGVLVTGEFSFVMGNGSNVRPDIAFGCGYHQVESGHQAKVAVDGILGLGRGSSDIVSQLKSQGFITRNVVSHCLSTRGGGYLFFGELDVPPSQFTWVPMDPVAPRKNNYYSAGKATLHLDTKSVGKKRVKVILDSGSTYTYLPTSLHTPLVSALRQSVSKSLRAVEDHGLRFCWTRPGGFKSLADLKVEFKTVMSLKFGNGATMVIPPENYLVVTERGNACLGMLEMRRTEMILIGDITLQDRLVVYDNENGRLGWIPFPCVPKSISAIFPRM